MTAYFTEPMGEEFRKALEEAMKDLEESGSREKSQRPRGNKKLSKKNRDVVPRRRARQRRVEGRTPALKNQRE